MAFGDLLHKASLSPDLNTNREIIWWWEKKRILYNAVMLIFGSVTLLLAYLGGAIKMFPWIGLTFFAVSANIFYTSGWIIDIAGRRFLSDQPISRRLSPILFLAGTVFSVFLTFAFDTAMLIAIFTGSVSHK